MEQFEPQRPEAHYPTVVCTRRSMRISHPEDFDPLRVTDDYC